MKKSKNDKKERKKETSLKEKIPLFIKGAFLIFFLSTVIGLSIFAYQLLHRSDYFFIRKSQIDWLNEPLGREPYKKLHDTGIDHNIFKFNISSAAGGILEAHPELKSIQIVRDFPDRLTLKMEPRLPVAQVGQKSFFLVDKEGVILNEARDTIKEDLPIITGIGWKPFRKVGQKEDSSRMIRALLLLNAISESGFLNDHILIKVDVSDYRNISFFIEDGLEVKIGHADFKERLKTLDKTFASMAIDKNQIRYIDLRFDDVVLGTK